MLPLVCALGAFLVPRAGRWLTLVAAAGLSLITWDMARVALSHGAQRYPLAGWGAPLGIELYADGAAVLMLALTVTVMGSVSLYAGEYFSSKHRHQNGSAHEGRAVFFWPLWLFLWCGLNALFLSADIFNLYVTLELVGLAAVTLAALEGGPGALLAATRYLLVSLLASFCFLLGVAVLYAGAATLDIELLRQSMTPGPLAWAGVSFMVTGLLIKTAVFPVHFWLPPAHAQASTPVSAVLSALVVKASFYLLLRLWFDLFSAVAKPPSAEFLASLGAAAVIWGSIQALRQERLKLLVAYSTVAQVGYLLLAIPLVQATNDSSGWAGCYYWALSHGCAKAAMFLAAGNLLWAAGHDRIAELGGAAKQLGLSMFAFLLAAVSLAGLPPSGGFIAKWLLLSASLASGQWEKAVVLVLGGLLTAAYAARVLRRAFVPATASEQPPRPVPRLLEWIAVSLSLLALLLGFYADPILRLLQVGAPTAGQAFTGGL
jgi:multicomponent Na+:H+ antiporter subunit D